MDLYCPDREHGEFLLFQDKPLGHRRLVAINAIRGVVLALVVAAASRDSMWPIYTIALAAGGTLVAMVLHAHQIGRRCAVVLWLAAGVVAGGVAASDLDPNGARAVWTVAVAVPLLAALFLGVTGVREVNRTDDDALPGIAVSVLAGAFAVAGWWLTTGPHADRFITFPDVITRWLLYSAIGATTTAVFLAALFSLITSFGDMDLSVRDPFGEPGRHHVDWRSTAAIPNRPPRGNTGAQLLWRIQLIRIRLGASLIAIARQTMNGLLVVVTMLIVAASRTANWLHRRVRLIGRRCVYVVKNGTVCLLWGVFNAGQGTRFMVRPLAAYVATVGGVIAALHLSAGFTRYLVDGPIASLGAGVGWSVIAVAASFALSERMSSENTATVLGAQFRFVESAGPDLAMLTIILGWIVGVPGLLGYGPIRVGWVTGIGTLVVIAAAAPEALRQRREKRRAASSTALS